MCREAYSSIGIGLKFKIKDFIENLNEENYKICKDLIYYLTVEGYSEDENEFFHKLIENNERIESIDNYIEYKTYLTELLNRVYKTVDTFDDINFFDEYFIYELKFLTKLNNYAIESGTNIKGISFDIITKLMNDESIDEMVFKVKTNNMVANLNLSVLPPYEKVFYLKSTIF